MKQTVLVVVILGLLSFIVNQIFGFTGKVVLVGIVVVASIATSGYCIRQKAFLRRSLRAMSPDELRDFAETCRQQGIEDPFEELNEPELSWPGKILDAAMELSGAFVPPMLYHQARGFEWAWDSPCTFWHLACMGAGVGLYTLMRKKALNRFMINTEPEFTV